MANEPKRERFGYKPKVITPDANGQEQRGYTPQNPQPLDADKVTPPSTDTAVQPPKEQKNAK